MAIGQAWIPYEAISTIAINAQGDALFPGGFGINAASFTVIVPGSEWSVELVPIDGGNDLSQLLSVIAPILWIVADPTAAAYVKIVPTNFPTPPNTLQLRVCKSDLVTPQAAGIAFVVGVTLLRRVGPPV